MKWNKIKESLSQKIIWEIFKYLVVFLISNGGFFIVLQKISTYFETIQTQWVFWSIMILAAVLIFIILYQRLNKNMPNFPVIESDFQILEEEITHKVIKKTEYIHIRRYKLKAKRNGLARYTDKFLWTGDNFEIYSGDDIHTVILSKKINVFNTYIIDFDRTYNKNDIIDATVEWKLYGEGRPFISTQIEEPTNKLIMNVEFNKDLNIKQVTFDECYIQAAKRTLKHIDLEIKNYCVSQTINNPKLLHTYELNWK